MYTKFKEKMEFIFEYESENRLIETKVPNGKRGKTTDSAKSSDSISVCQPLVLGLVLTMSQSTSTSHPSPHS